MPVTESRGPGHHSWGSLASALIPHSPPWIAWALLPAFASVARTYWATTLTSAMLSIAGIVVVAFGLVLFALHAFRARGHSVRVHAAASIATAAAWLVTAMAVGFSTKAVWSVWILGGVGMCLAWNVRRIAKGDGSDHHDDDSGQKITAAIGLAGSRFRAPKVEGPKVKAPLQLVKGEQTTADAQAAARRMDSKLGLRPGATRVIANKNDESLPMVEIVPKDPLVKTLRWTGPKAPGESIAEIIEFATREDSTRAGLWLPGQKTEPVRVSAHIKVAGITGSGKTETGLIVCAEALTRCDASLVYIDTVKGIQSIRSIIHGVDLPIIDRAKAIAAQKRLRDVIRARTQWLGEHGFDQWEPGCGLKYLIWWIEEGADLLANSSTFVKDTEQARSAGITIVVSQQRWTFDRMDTSARANFGAAICFGVDNEDSAGAVLSEETLDANARPWVWKNSKPGYLYLEAPGVDSELWPLPARSDLAEKGHLTEVVAEFAKPGLDYVTAIALGELYSDHVSLVAEGRASWQQQPVTATRMPVRAVDDDDLEDEDEDDELDALDDDEDMVIPPNPEPGFMDDIDPTKDIPGDDDPIIAIGLPMAQVNIGRTEAIEILKGEIRDRANAGMDHVRPSELVDFRLRVGRGPSWLTGVLQELVDEGFLEEHPDRGVYGIPAPVPA
jgi:hypothetical protein